MCVVAGMNPCFNANCLLCDMTGGYEHPVMDKLHLTYTTSVTCTNKGVYIMIDKVRNYIEAGSTTDPYSLRISNKFCSDDDKLHTIRNDWTVFGLGTSGTEHKDRYVEDIFILLITTVKNFSYIHSELNIFDIRRPKILEFINDHEDVFKYLYSTEIFYTLLFNPFLNK